MRTLGFRTHVLMAIAAAAGLVATLGRPWYASAPVTEATDVGIGDINGPLNQFFDGVERWVVDPAGTTGWDSLDHAGLALAAMAGVAALGGLACLAAPLQALGRDLLRYGALAAFAIVAWRLVDSPGANAQLELRHGALAAAGCAAVLLTCALGVASAPLRRRVAPRSYVPPPPPPVFGSAGPPPSG
jgi:hypothetical protein